MGIFCIQKKTVKVHKKSAEVADQKSQPQPIRVSVNEL
jgi:hypothetical protein